MLGVGELRVVQGPNDSVGGVNVGGVIDAPVAGANLHGLGQVGPGWGWFGSDAPGGRVVDELMAQSEGVKRGFGGCLRFHGVSWIVP